MKNAEQIFEEIKNEIISNVNDDALIDGELANEKAWIDEIQKSLDEDHNHIEISQFESKSGNPITISF